MELAMGDCTAMHVKSLAVMEGELNNPVSCICFCLERQVLNERRSYTCVVSL